jgi:ParB family chromosome partitioning protein
MSKKRLGRDLGSLLSSTAETPPPTARDGVAPRAQDSAAVLELPIDDIQPSPYQPRREFDDDALEELAASIKAQGLLQPVVVRPRPLGGYELIAGERRWRAAARAGLVVIPAVAREVNDREASALALIENMQREDLNALEEALGLARLRDEFELTQQEIADSVGKSRVAIANLLRLLNLGTVAKELLQRGALEMGHARTLLGLEGVRQDNAAREVARQGLSVRQTEALVKRLTSPTAARPAVARTEKDPDVARLERRITESIGAPVNIKHGKKGGGELVIGYSSLDELDGVLKHLGISE